MTDFRCTAAGLLRDEPLAGTASTVRAFLLLEHAGPWGVDALRDARLPDGLGDRLLVAAAASKVRVLLVRRPGRRPTATGPLAVMAAYADPHEPWLETTTVHDLADVLDLDLPALRAGQTLGLQRDEEPVFAVCTHGRHDACCAERGRPVAQALAQASPEETWEVSHIGGDRFAGNAVVLPHGLYYGRLDPASAVALAGSTRAGHLDLDRLRGRSGHPMPVQAAEIALRRELGETRDDAVRLVGRRVEGADTSARFEVAGSAYDVTVRTTHSTDRHQLTCRAERDHPIPKHEVRSVSLRDGPVRAMDPPSAYS